MVDLTLYRLASEQTKDYGLFLLDPDGRIITWNVGAQRIKGYAADEIIGRHFSTFYTREAIDRGWPAHELKVAAMEGRFEDEGWRIRKDGARFWAHVVITALRDENGKLRAYSKIIRDLTDRKLRDEALRQSEERFRLLIEGVLDYAIYILDPEGVICSWNAGGQLIKGYRPDEIIGKHVSHFYLQRDVDAGKPWAELATARREGRAEEEGWRLKKNGEQFWARVVVSALHDGDGHLRGYAKVTQDLSERRHLQDLEKAAKNLNEFIAILAHELRNPLAAIRNAVQCMAHVPAGAPAREPLLQVIGRQSAQLARILDDMVDISRVTRGSLVLERAPVDLADIVRRAVETATPLIEAGKHTLAVDLPPKRIIVDGDADRLTQIITNLLSNSACYTPSGGHIAVRARARQGWVNVSVRDNGTGIDPQLMDRIFDMFVQGRDPLHRVGGGLGIGLALARRIAELHGGSLEGHSEGENKGTEFTVRLPLSGAPQSANGNRVDTSCGKAVEPFVPRRILVVDDNVDAAMALNGLLQSLGHETCVVYNGLEALKMAIEFRPDVVLLDIGMPDLDGYEVARRLRVLKKERAFRIIAVTGWAQQSDRQKSQEAGFDVHLVKPISRKELNQVLGETNGGATFH